MKSIKTKLDYDKNSKNLKVNFDYELKKYGICHISFTFHLSSFSPKVELGWTCVHREYSWEKYKESKANDKNLYLQFTVLNDLLEDYINFEFVQSIETVTELQGLYDGIKYVEITQSGKSIQQVIKDELRQLLRCTEYMLVEYALEEFEAELM